MILIRFIGCNSTNVLALGSLEPFPFQPLFRDEYGRDPPMFLELSVTWYLLIQFFNLTASIADCKCWD